MEGRHGEPRDPRTEERVSVVGLHIAKILRSKNFIVDSRIGRILAGKKRGEILVDNLDTVGEELVRHPVTT
jgi:hypothetical protein